MAAPADHEYVRVRVHLDCKNLEARHDNDFLKPKRWVLISFSDCPTISDVEKKVTESFEGKLKAEIWLGGYWLPSNESSRILRDGDEVTVKTEDVSVTSDVSKKTCRKSAHNSQSSLGLVRGAQAKSCLIEEQCSRSKKQRLSGKDGSDNQSDDINDCDSFEQKELSLTDTVTPSPKKKKKKKKSCRQKISPVLSERYEKKSDSLESARNITEADTGFEDQKSSRKRKRNNPEEDVCDAPKEGQMLCGGTETETPTFTHDVCNVNLSGSASKTLTYQQSDTDAVTETVVENVDKAADERKTETGEIFTPEDKKSVSCRVKTNNSSMCEHQKHDVKNVSRAGPMLNGNKKPEVSQQASSTPQPLWTKKSRDYVESLIKERKEQLVLASTAGVGNNVPSDRKGLEKRVASEDKLTTTTMMDTLPPHGGPQQDERAYGRGASHQHNCLDSPNQTNGGVGPLLGPIVVGSQELVAKRRRRKRKKKNSKKNCNTSAVTSPEESPQAPPSVRDYSLRLPPHLRPRPANHLRFDDDDNDDDDRTSTPTSEGAVSGSNGKESHCAVLGTSTSPAAIKSNDKILSTPHLNNKTMCNIGFGGKKSLDCQSITAAESIQNGLDIEETADLVPDTSFTVNNNNRASHYYKAATAEGKRPTSSKFVSAEDKFKSLLGSTNRTPERVQAGPVTVINEEAKRGCADRRQVKSSAPDWRGTKQSSLLQACVNVSKVLTAPETATKQEEQHNGVDHVTKPSTPSSGRELKNDLVYLRDKIQHHTTDVKCFQDLKELPKAGDVIAYKILELSSDYTPVISDFKKARVMEVDSQSDPPQLNLLMAVAEEKRKGRFELDAETDGNGDNFDQTNCLTTVSWPELREPKLVAKA